MVNTPLGGVHHPRHVVDGGGGEAPLHEGLGGGDEHFLLGRAALPRTGGDGGRLGDEKRGVVAFGLAFGVGLALFAEGLLDALPAALIGLGLARFFRAGMRGCAHLSDTTYCRVCRQRRT